MLIWFCIATVITLIIFIDYMYVLPCPKCRSRRTRELSRHPNVIEFCCKDCNCVFPFYIE